MAPRLSVAKTAEAIVVSSTIMVYFEHAGVAQYPGDLDPANPDADYGNVLCRLGSRLDAIAHHLGVRPLSDFHFAEPDMLNEILADLEGPHRASLERLIATQQQWHPVVEGRKTTAALLSYLEGLDDANAIVKHPELAIGGTLQPVIADLRALDCVLAGSDARFHLSAL
jgi:hypothetical protein